MKESQIINQSTNNASYTNWLWNYGKQALKGIGVMGVGILGYVGLRGYWQSQSASTQAKPESTNLVASSDTSMAVDTNANGLTSTASSSAAGQGVWDAAGQSVRYRRKRDTVPLGGQFRVNAIGGVNSQKIAGLPNGEFVVTWTSTDSSGYGIYAQRFANGGTWLSNNFQVNNYTNNDQWSSAVSSLSNGNFVITWSSYGQDSSGSGIYAQRFANDGTLLGNEFQVNNYTMSDQRYPAVDSLANGDFVITWSSYGQDGSDYGIYAQRFASNGTRLGNEFQVNTNTTSAQVLSVVSGLPNGDFVIAWSSNGQDGSDYGVYAQRFAGNGMFLGNEFQVNNYTIGEQGYPAIDSLLNGGFVITWSSMGQDGSGYGVYAQRFASNGTRLDNEFQVNTYTASNQMNPVISGLSNGEFVVVWASDLQYGFYAQRFAATGAPIGNEFQVSSGIITFFTLNYPNNGQYSASIAGLPGLTNGDFVVTWPAGGAGYARLFTVLYQPPQVIRNQIIMGQGQTIILGRNQFLAVTESVSVNNLQLTASNVTSGWFANINNPGVPIVNFTQVDINNGQIQFTQDDSYNAPSYQMAVFDGVNMLAPQSAMVDFDQKPRWINHQIPIINHRQLPLSSTVLLATDDRNNTQVTFELRNINHGVFALSSVADPFTNPITTFTQQQVNASQINFAHDGSNISPSCEIRASDGRLYTAYQPCQFTFTPNHPPQLTRNELTLVKGEQKVVDGTSLAASDPDALTADELGQLMFNFTAIARGQFVLSTNQSLAVTWAYQSQVAAGQLIFKHDGSDQAPSYNVSVYDGYVATESQATSVNFALSNVKDTTGGATVGGAIGGTGAALLLAGVGIFGAYRYRRSKQFEDQRCNYPLANALYHELNIAGTEDFQSEKGIAFTNAVDSLNNELIRAGVDIKQMVSEEIEELAHKLANATKAQLGKKINPFDIQDYAQGIVATAMTLSGKRKLKEGDVELDVVVRGSNTGRKLLFDALEDQLQHEGLNMGTLSADRAKLLANQFIKIIRKDFVELDTQTTTDAQPVKAWRPGAIAN